MSRLVCIIGIDGTGKTPHSRILADTLKSWGTPSRYVWARWHPMLLKPVEAILAWLMHKTAQTSPKNYSAYSVEKRRLVHRQTMVFLWAKLVMLDYGIQLLFKVRWPLFLGKTVICDRYVYDTLVDFIADFKLSSHKTAQLLRTPLMELFAKPDLIFVLDIAEKVASERKGDATLGFVEYLATRRNVYLEMAERFHGIVLDASDFQKVQQIITKRVELARAQET